LNGTSNHITRQKNRGINRFWIRLKRNFIQQRKKDIEWLIYYLN
jgi:hypothetical protein